MRAEEILEDKIAEALETNEDEALKRPIVHPTDHGDESRTAAPVDGAKYWEEFFSGTRKTLDAVFDDFSSAQAKDKSFIDEHFTTKGYESHSPLLRKYSEAGYVPSGETLSERTRNLLPR